MAAKRALIIGDSQAQGAGAVLESLLEASGYQVKRYGFPGYPTYRVLEKAKDLYLLNFDLICVFSGSNDSPGDHSSAIKICNIWPEATVWWFAPPPATQILDLDLARKVFGSKVKAKDYWITSGFAKTREQIAQEFRETLQPLAPRVRYLDIRQAFPEGYPDQPDGVHINNNTAKRALPVLIASIEQAVDLPVDQITPVVETETPKKKTPWGTIGLVAAGAVALWAYSGKSKRNPQLTPNQQRNLVWGLAATAGALWLLWPKQAKASELMDYDGEIEMPKSEEVVLPVSEESELLKLIKPVYLRGYNPKKREWPHEAWGNPPESVARENVALIDKMMKDAGYPLKARAAAVVNAWSESAFNHLAVGDNKASVGLFQLNKWGGGMGMTKEQRIDRVTNITRMLDSIEGRPVPKHPDTIAKKWKKLVDSGETDLATLAGQFCRYFERPKNTEEDVAKRRALAKAMFPSLA